MIATNRLELSRPTDADFDELFELHSDPQVWEHYPALRHSDPEETRAMLTGVQQAWERDGLASWVARSAQPQDRGTLVGIGGCAIRRDSVWNLYYRLSRVQWGKGYAQEIIAAARDVASQLRPELPVTAYLLERNRGSLEAAARAGLELVWRGHDEGNPDPSAVRLIYADRPLDDGTLEGLIGSA